MIHENGLHPFVSIAIIALSILFITSSAKQVLSSKELCLDYVSHAYCIGREPSNISLPPPDHW